MISAYLRRFVVACLLLLGAGLHSMAADFSLGLNTLLNGTDPSTNNLPCLSVTFTNLFPGKVSIILEAMLDSPEFISEVALNINPELNGQALEFIQTSGPAADSVTVAAKDNGISVPGGGSSAKGFDILFSWPSGNKADRFDLSEVTIFTISGPSDLDAEDFFFGNTLSTGDGNVIVSAHIQGIPLPDGTTTSGTVGVFMPPPVVPEPGSFWMWCMGAAWFAWTRRFGQ